jgi:RNA polymerase sigma factor (sigma-70 family)
MNADNANARLSRITTLWSLVGQAHHPAGVEVNAAQEKLLHRYGGAIRRYLLGAVHDADTAADLFQEFAYRFLHGGLRGVDPQRGRFRDYVKSVLFHLVADHHKKRQRLPVQLPAEHPEPAVACPVDHEAELAFRTTWRDDLLARTWSALAEADRASGQCFYAVLRFRADHPALHSPEMAEQLSAQLGKPMTAAGTRKTLERARDRFADLLLDEIAESLTDPSPERLEEELIDLNLLEHCRSALERRRTLQ